MNGTEIEVLGFVYRFSFIQERDKKWVLFILNQYGVTHDTSYGIPRQLLINSIAIYIVFVAIVI